MQTKLFTAASLMFAAAAAVQADVVYSNTNSPSGANFNSGNLLIGDEINLDGTARQLTQFDFQYYGINFSGNESATVTLYANDGVLYNGFAARPNSVLWSSGSFAIGPTPGATLKWSVADANLPANIVLPNRLTFAIQFSGIEVGESAGVALYNPPTAGNSLDDYWEYDIVNDWHLKTNATYVMNFGAQVQAVPEPSFWALAILGGMCGFCLVRRRTAK